MSELVTKEELEALGAKWAVVAFAARCARRVLPLFEAWEGATAEQVAAVRYAIEAAEKASSSGEAVYAYTDAADAAADAAYAAYAARAAGDAAYAARAAVNAANAGAYAARAAVNAANAGANAASAHVVASMAGSGNPEDTVYAFPRTMALDAIMADFWWLRTAAEQEGWTDETPVPPDFFGDMWPEGPPPGWPGTGTAKTSEPQELSSNNEDQQNVFDDIEPLTLLVEPGTASPEEIGELLGEISTLYRMVGGSGLTFTLADVWSTEGVTA